MFMLLNFRAKNFKAFKNGFELNMRASLIQDLNYSVRSNLTDKRVLTSSVIYGPNASGKTTIIEAMQFFRDLVLEGTIENSTRKDFVLSANKELVPFALDDEINPVEFEIAFIKDSLEYNYGVSFYIGAFDEEDYNRQIIKEYLKINSKEIFNRTADKVNVNYKNIDDEFVVRGLNESNKENYISIFNQNLDKEKLFLNTHFATMVSKELYEKIYSWFTFDFLIIHSFNRVRMNLNLGDNSYSYLPDFAYAAVKKIGVLGTTLKFVKDENGKSVLLSTFDNGKTKHTIPSNIIESFGTLRFLDLFPLILDSITSGATLVIDELDTSLHPMVIMSIANVYHDPEINTKHAQLIFNTHNPVFLNNKIFRRDEMCFVEKDAETNISEFYKLSDFQTNSSTPTRNTTDYLNNYFMNRYGAIEYVDLSDVFRDILSNGVGVEKNEETAE